MGTATGNKRSYRMGERAASTAATRQAILDAAIDSDDPRLPLAAIAEQAGVSQRTLLRHFGSRAGLFAAALAEGNARIRAERFDAPPGEIDAAVASLVRHYEEHGDRVVARLAVEGEDALVDELLAAGRRLHRDWVETTLGPLLGRLDARARRRRLAQLVAVCDVYTWKLLRRDSGLGAKETERAIAELIRGLTEEGDNR